MYRSSAIRPAQYETENPPKAWNVATFGHFAESRIWKERNGTKRLVVVDDVELLALEHARHEPFEAQ